MPPNLGAAAVRTHRPLLPLCTGDYHHRMIRECFGRDLKDHLVPPRARSRDTLPSPSCPKSHPTASTGGESPCFGFHPIHFRPDFPPSLQGGVQGRLPSPRAPLMDLSCCSPLGSQSCTTSSAVPSTAPGASPLPQLLGEAGIPLFPLFPSLQGALGCPKGSAEPGAVDGGMGWAA